MHVHIFFAGMMHCFKDVSLEINRFGTLEVTDNKTQKVFAKFTAPYGYVEGDGESEGEGDNLIH